MLMPVTVSDTEPDSGVRLIIHISPRLGLPSLCPFFASRIIRTASHSSAGAAIHAQKDREQL